MGTFTGSEMANAIKVEGGTGLTMGATAIAGVM